MLTVKTIWCLQILNVATAPNPATAKSLTHCDSWSVGSWEKWGPFFKSDTIFVGVVQLGLSFFFFFSFFTQFSVLSLGVSWVCCVMPALPPTSSHNPPLLPSFCNCWHWSPCDVGRHSSNGGKIYRLGSASGHQTPFPLQLFQICFLFSYWSLLEAEEVLTGHHCIQITLSFHRLTHRSW